MQAFLNQPDAVPQVSVLTRMECRVQPLREGNAELLADYDAFFGSLDGGLLDMNAALFEKATELRARLNLGTPDALHLATAISSACDVFLTNDRALTRCTEIRVQVLEESR
ncbi:MAG: PIN domain-containing protein [Verrucomicrobia bacterium]|nr:PIN domain-containing protein [Verrucomicrobiota bacterium]